MKRSLNIIAKNSLKIAATAVVLAVATGLVPQAAHAAPKYAKGKPENPIGALVGAGAVGSAVLLLKSRKRLS
jgi:hypothetical protein